MKIVTAFFMAWGNFLTLPCPYKKWDSKLNNLMLAFLPSVGLVIGVIWAGIFLALNYINTPRFLLSAVMVFYIFAVCGFMHLDGFMDCNDAILSRRPLEDKQRILKDSTVGAFAVVTIVFLIMAWFAAMTTEMDKVGHEYTVLMIIPIISRGISGYSVLANKPIGHSQYVEGYKEKGKGKYKVIIVIQVIFFTAMSCFIGAKMYSMLFITAAMLLSGFLVCLYARKQLGGMSGDIAGYTICFSELVGIIVLSLL